MVERVTVKVADLLLDLENARVREPQKSQQEAMHALALQQKARLVELAESIVDAGLDPMSSISVTREARGRHRVVEGNRRTLALKALDSPQIVSAALSAGQQRKMAKLAARFADDPIDAVECVVLDAQAVDRWVTLRHTGMNNGRGLVEWNAAEKDRYLARHGAPRKPGGQLIDFVDSIVEPDPDTSGARILTNMQRLIGTAYVRDKLGITIVDGQVYSRFPLEQISKALRRIVSEFRSGDTTVKDVYHTEDREKYINKFGPGDLPDPATELPQPVALDALQSSSTPSGTSAAGSSTGSRGGSNSSSSRERTTIAPRSTKVKATGRAKEVLTELRTLDVETFPNAGAVLLRMFLELSMDAFIASSPTPIFDPQAQRGKIELQHKVTRVADALAAAGKMDKKELRAIKRVAGDNAGLAATTASFNDYTHNIHIFPKPRDLRRGWDELETFLGKVWS